MGLLMWTFQRASSRLSIEEDKPDYLSRARPVLGITRARYMVPITLCSHANFGIYGPQTSCKEWSLALALTRWETMSGYLHAWTSIRLLARPLTATVVKQL